MTDERNPWDQQEGEPNRWFQRFSAYRLMGPGRSLLGAVNQEKADKGRERQTKAPGSWNRTCELWSWHARANAWDDDVIKQADAKWREQIMGEAELLARLSQMGRANINDFIEIDRTGHISNINKNQLATRGHLVRKISTSEGRTNSISLELYPAPEAMQMLGKHLRLFEKDDQVNMGNGQPFELPASCVAPAFLDAYDDIKAHAHTEYVFHGGRGSTKSTFISLVIIYILKNNPSLHVIALRQVANTLRDSVYAQLVWAITELGLDDQFKCLTSPLEITYLPTGQKIYFRGTDEPGKIKSIKPSFGYIGIAWFEELDQFHGEEAIRNIEQSAIRGGDLAYIFKSFNPPRTAASWVNKYVQIPKANQYQHHSTYLELGSRIRWLGKPWCEEAEHLKAVNPKAYEHEYLGIANGTGGLVFENVVIRKITDEEIYGKVNKYGIKEGGFDRVLHGLDWGYYPDPAAYVRCHYDAARMTLYIFAEHRAQKTSNRQLYDDLIKKGLTNADTLIADSAEPKSVADFREYGSSCRGAEKGPESVKYSMKWLQSLKAIVIDNERCPYSADELLNYELEQDKDGNFISEYPDRNNHFIDGIRYATNMIWKRRGQ